MKVLLLADIHSNIYALNAVEAAEAPFDMVLCVGDIVDWGMDPVEAIQWLEKYNYVAVSGNHDDFVVSADKNEKRIRMGLEPEAGTYQIDYDPIGQEKNFMTYTLNLLSERELGMLQRLPSSAVVEIDGFTYYLKHTSEEEKGDIVLKAMKEFRSQVLFDRLWEETGRQDVPMEKRRIVFAHSHQCWMHLVRGGALFMNPGSISNRTLGSDNIEPGADYIVIQDGVPQMKHVSYPTEELRKRIAEAPFEERIKEMALQLHTPE